MEPLRVMVPILASGIVFGLAALAFARPFGDGPASRKACSVALFLAYLTGHWWIEGTPEVVPERALDWLPYLALLGLGLCFVEPKKLRVAGFVFAAGLVPWLVLGHKIGRWDVGEAILWLGLCSAFLVSALLAWEKLATRLGTRWWGLVSMTFAASLAYILVVSGDLKLGQLAGALAAGSGALVTVNWLWPRIEGTAAFVPVFAILAFGLLATGHVDFFGYVPRAVTALVWFAPFSALALPKTTKPGIALAVVALVLAVAIVIAHSAAPSLDPYDEYR